jgi:hypothetical protein
VPTQKVSVPSPRNFDIRRKFVSIKLPRHILQCIHRETFHLLQRRIGAELVAFGQQQIAAIPDSCLSDLGKSLQQPRQRHLQPDVVILHVEMA